MKGKENHEKNNKQEKIMKGIIAKICQKEREYRRKLLWEYFWKRKGKEKRVCSNYLEKLKLKINLRIIQENRNGHFKER